jgi:hypothetical protein
MERRIVGGVRNDTHRTVLGLCLLFCVCLYSNQQRALADRHGERKRNAELSKGQLSQTLKLVVLIAVFQLLAVSIFTFLLLFSFSFLLTIFLP